MSVCLLIISDGREEYLQRTLASAEEHLPSCDQVVHIDDTHHQLGFAGAIQAGWDRVQTDYVFHLEANVTFNRSVPLDDMRQVLDENPHLTQIALLRQPWNRAEQGRSSSSGAWSCRRLYWIRGTAVPAQTKNGGSGRGGDDRRRAGCGSVGSGRSGPA